MMSKEMEYFIYLIEHYAAYKNKNANEVMKELEKLKLVEEILNRYEFYHIEKIENAYDDIDKLIADKRINNF